MPRKGAPPVVLSIAGSDPSGGAGIQADLKTFHAFGYYGEAVLTALTVQNTRGVTGVHAVPAAFVARQIEAVLDDIPPAATKTGMLATKRLVETVARVLKARRVRKLVVDPVMVSTTGHRLLDRGAESAIREQLLPLAAIVTPNLPEAEVLSGVRIKDDDAAVDAGRRLLGMGAKAALVKGGHGKGRQVHDVLVEKEAVTVFSNPRLRTRSTHGTGCTLSAALACGLARGISPAMATETAVWFVHRAIREAPGFGKGKGPVSHLSLDWDWNRA